MHTLLLKTLLIFSIFNWLLCTAGGAYYLNRPGNASHLLFIWALSNLGLSVVFYFLWQRAKQKAIK